MSLGLEARFEAYCDTMLAALMHADREQPARWYSKGLLLPGERKSVQPMAARVQPQAVRSTHQLMHHLVADAPCRDETLMSAVVERVLPKRIGTDEPVWWMVDDTGFPKIRQALGGGGTPVLWPQRQAGSLPGGGIVVCGYVQGQRAGGVSTVSGA